MSYLIILVLAIVIGVLWTRMRQLDENVANIHTEYLTARAQSLELSGEVEHKDKQINGILRDIRELRALNKELGSKSASDIHRANGKTTDVQKELKETKDLLTISKEANKIRLDELDRIADLWCSPAVSGMMREVDIEALNSYTGIMMARIFKRLEELTFEPGAEPELTEKEKTVRVNRMYNAGMTFINHFKTNKAIFEEALVEITDIALNFHKAFMLYRDGKGDKPIAAPSKDWETGSFLIPQFEAILVHNKIAITPDLRELIITYIGILTDHVKGIATQLNTKEVQDIILLTGFFSVASTDSNGVLLHRLHLPLFGMEHNERKRIQEASKLLKF